MKLEGHHKRPTIFVGEADRQGRGVEGYRASWRTWTNSSPRAW